VLVGAQISLAAGVLAVLIGAAIGTVLGLLAGYYGS
jgi:glutathione transport system permease protein